MAIQTEPTRIQIPFADSGTKNVIPDTNSTPSASQAASWTDGFPAQCSLPLSAGGIPPARADFNGVFNTMTQSERFTQEGGVWAWDATVDYGTNRVVLGSDGLLYWSVAQSGPNVGGAQDPTIDNGSYWGSMPLNAPGLGDKSASAATTEWVKDLATASVYVSPAGDDANDGMSAGNAVQTIAKAVQIAKTLPQDRIEIVVSGGSYSGDVDIPSINIILSLQGDVTVSGIVRIYRSSIVLVYGAFDLSINGRLIVEQSSFLGAFNLSISVVYSGSTSLAVTDSTFYSHANIAVTGSNADFVSFVGRSVVMLVNNATFTLTANGSITDCALSITENSYLRCQGLFTLNGISCKNGVTISLASNANFDGGHNIQNILSGNCFNVEYKSFLGIGGSCSAYGYSYLVMREGSCAEIYDRSSLTANSTGGSDAFFSVVRHSTLTVLGSLTLSTTVAKTCVASYDSGVVLFQGGNVSISGTWGTIVSSGDNSVINIVPSVTFSGSPTGKRYNVSYGGIVNVNGSGVNRIPGTTAGTADSAHYAMYF